MNKKKSGTGNGAAFYNGIECLFCTFCFAFVIMSAEG